MRHFIVLGFSSHSKDETGESLYLGNDRSKAIDEVNSNGKYARKELHELAVPNIRRQHKPKPKAPRKKVAKKEAETSEA